MYVICFVLWIRFRFGQWRVGFFYFFRTVQLGVIGLGFQFSFFVVVVFFKCKVSNMRALDLVECFTGFWKKDIVFFLNVCIGYYRAIQVFVNLNFFIVGGLVFVFNYLCGVGRQEFWGCVELGCFGELGVRWRRKGRWLAIWRKEEEVGDVCGGFVVVGQ